MWSKSKSQADIPDGVDLDAWPPVKGARARAILDDFEDTREMYASFEDGSWIWDVDRATWHQDVVDSLVGPFEAPVGRRPRAVFSAGGPASGKSSALEVFDKSITDGAVWINPDAMKEEIEEYREMVSDLDPYAAHGAHEESSHMAKEALAEALRRKLDFVLDGTGSKKSFVTRLVDTAALGYDVHVVAMDVATDVAAERAMIRAFGSYASSVVGDGRMVPLTHLRRTHAEVARMHLEWRDLPEIRAWSMYSNEVERGDAPLEIATRVVTDESRYRSAVEKSSVTD